MDDDFGGRIRLSSARASRRNIGRWILPVMALLLFVGYAGWSEYRRLQEQCSATSASCFDSGWKPVNNTQTATYFFKHHLGTSPAELTIWFSPTADGARAFPLLWRLPNNESGNPISIEAKPDAVYIHIWNGMPVHGHFEMTGKKWTTYNSGFFRVVARR